MTENVSHGPYAGYLAFNMPTAGQPLGVPGTTAFAVPVQLSYGPGGVQQGPVPAVAGYAPHVQVGPSVTAQPQSFPFVQPQSFQYGAGFAAFPVGIHAPQSFAPLPSQFGAVSLGLPASPVTYGFADPSAQFQPGTGLAQQGFGFGQQGRIGTPSSVTQPFPPGALPQMVRFPQLISRVLGDEEIEEIIYEAIDNDPFISWNAEVEVRCENGQVSLTGTVPNKRIKHSVGEIAWWVPGVVDVHNSIVVASRRGARGRIQRGERLEVPGGQPAEKRKPIA
jgi:hypothetical protein